MRISREHDVAAIGKTVFAEHGGLIALRLAHVFLAQHQRFALASGNFFDLKRRQLFLADEFTGEFFGVLGPNGAGKTTTIGILTTRVRLTAGQAIVAGADVVREPARVRQRIGVVPQRANPDRGLNVVENLIFRTIERNTVQKWGTQS